MTIAEIYELLASDEEKGWALVNRKNVQTLITMALENGNEELERELLNWS